MASRNASFYDRGIAGVLLAPLKGVCIGMMILLGLMLAAWFIDWVFVFRVWPEGIARLQGILDQELARTHTFECWCGHLPQIAAGTANFFYDLMFRMSGIHEMGVRFADSAALSIPDTILRSAYVASFEGIRVAMVGTQLFGVRLAALSAGLPLFVLVYCWAIADGLVQRGVRRAGGGRESASIYHRAKYLQMACLAMAAAIFLIWPSSTDVRAISGMAFAIVAVLVRVQWSFYKKHL